jgi:hypothetical protein
MPIVTLPGGQVRDEIRQPIYDTIDLLPTVSPVGTSRFFSNVQGRSLAKTNLRQNNLLETAVSFRVQGLALDAQNDAIANVGVIPVILIRSSLRLHIGEKDYWSGPSRFAGGRMWAAYAAATTAGTTTINNVLQQYGYAAIQPVVFQGKHVIDINPLQSFFCEWVIGDMTSGEVTAATPAASTDVSFLFSLKGLQRRPVQ